MCVADYKLGHHTQARAINGGAVPIQLDADPRRLSVFMSGYADVYNVSFGSDTNEPAILYFGSILDTSATNQMFPTSLHLDAAKIGQLLYGPIRITPQLGTGGFGVIEVIALPELDRLITSKGL